MSPRTIIRQVATCIFCLIFTAFASSAVIAAAAAGPVAAGAAATEAATPATTPTGAAAPAATPAPAPTPVVQLAPNVAAELAHSALLKVEGTATADSLQLRIQRVSDQSLVGGNDVTVTFDGKNAAVTRDNSGAYELPVDELRGDVGRDVEIIVGHDGIREILTAKVSAAPQAASAEGLLRDHKQVAWWILNIVIVLIAAIAISRRKG